MLTWFPALSRGPNNNMGPSSNSCFAFFSSSAQLTSCEDTDVVQRRHSENIRGQRKMHQMLWWPAGKKRQVVGMCGATCAARPALSAAGRAPAFAVFSISARGVLVHPHTHICRYIYKYHLLCNTHLYTTIHIHIHLRTYIY